MDVGDILSNGKYFLLFSPFIAVPSVLGIYL